MPWLTKCLNTRTGQSLSFGNRAMLARSQGMRKSARVRQRLELEGQSKLQVAFEPWQGSVEESDQVLKLCFFVLICSRKFVNMQIHEFVYVDS